MRSLPKFSSLFKKKLSTLDKEVPIKVHVKQGNPLFTIKDICATINPIARLARMFSVDNEVTDQELEQRHKEYCDAQGMFPNMSNTDRNNLKRAILKNRMSVMVFEKFADILGYRIVDVAYTLQNTVTGEIKIYKTSETEDYVRKHSDKS